MSSNGAGGRRRPPVLAALGFTLAMALPFGAAAARAIVDGRTELAACDAALVAGDVAGATVHARRAAGWYVPGAAHVETAYARLRTIGLEAEARGDRDAALFAWRSIRAASLGTAFAIEPHRAARAFADRRVAELSAEAPASPVQRDARPDDLLRAHLADLAREPGPRPAWTTLAALGLAAFAVGAVAAVRRGLGRDGGIDLRAAKAPLALALVGAAAWVVGLFRA